MQHIVVRTVDAIVVASSRRHLVLLLHTLFVIHVSEQRLADITLFVRIRLHTHGCVHAPHAHNTYMNNALAVVVVHTLRHERAQLRREFVELGIRTVHVTNPFAHITHTLHIA